MMLVSHPPTFGALRRALLALAALALVGGATACSSSREIVPLNGPDGKPIRFVYRHRMRAKDAETRDAIVGAIVGVRSSDDAVWQVDLTDESGGVDLSQEYDRTEVYNDQRTTFFVTTQNTIRLRAPAFQMTVRHPGYETYDQGYGAQAFVDRPRLVLSPALRALVTDPEAPVADAPPGVPDHAYAELSRPVLVPMDVPLGKERMPTATAAPFTIARIAESLSTPQVHVHRQVREGSTPGGKETAFSVGPAVHGGAFTRATGTRLVPETAVKLYWRPDDDAYVLLAPIIDRAAAPTHAAMVVSLCDSADLVLHARAALAEGVKAPSDRWVPADRESGAASELRIAVATAGLDAGIGAGARKVALVYPLALLPALDARLKERKLELVAEWWK